MPLLVCFVVATALTSPEWLSKLQFYGVFSATYLYILRYHPILEFYNNCS